MKPYRRPITWLPCPLCGSYVAALWHVLNSVQLDPPRCSACVAQMQDYHPKG